jgi:2-keto-4-pentenoate hydratase/2-oxohepta-3-ene-1,7-dioic acid hydratase in catechol pathway
VRIWHQSMGSVQMNDVGGPISEHARKVVVHGLPAAVLLVREAAGTHQHAWNKPGEIITRFTELCYANGVTKVKDAPVLDTFGYLMASGQPWTGRERIWATFAADKYEKPIYGTTGGSSFSPCGCACISASPLAAGWAGVKRHCLVDSGEQVPDYPDLAPNPPLYTSTARFNPKGNRHIMKIRRIYRGDDTLQTEVQADGGTWQSATPRSALGYDSPFTGEWEAGHARRYGAQPDDPVLPFQPVSVRDFSLSEQHNTDAAYGYARRFMPGAARLAGAVRTVTGRTLPALRPNKLWYAQPIYYLNNPMTFVPSGTAVEFPSYTQALDYEIQLAFVIGSPLRDATPEQAEKAITAFAVMCDFSARDAQIPEMKSGMGPQKAKHFLSSMATVAVSADEILPRWRDLRGTVTINGEVVARPHTAGSRFSLGDMLAHASASEQLVPGEMFSIGALSAGSGMEISRWLAHGDSLELDLPGVGHITHQIK